MLISALSGAALVAAGATVTDAAIPGEDGLRRDIWVMPPALGPPRGGGG